MRQIRRNRFAQPLTRLVSGTKPAPLRYSAPVAVNGRINTQAGSDRVLARPDEFQARRQEPADALHVRLSGVSSGLAAGGAILVSSIMRSEIP